MLTDQWQGFTGLPDYTDPSNIPTYLKNLFDFLGARAIPRYNTVADRDAELASPANGQLAWVAADSTLYMRSGGAWGPALRGGLRRGVKVVATSAQSIPTGESTPTRFDQIEADAALNSAGMWSTADRYNVVIPVSGFYLIQATFSYASGTGSRINRIMVNGQPVREWSWGSANSYYVTSASHMRYLSAGATVRIDHYQGSGSALNTHSQDYPSLEVALLG